MTDAPVFHQLNIVADDFDATVAFYRLLGIRIEEAPRSPDGIRHAKARTAEGLLLEFDNHVLAQTYNAAWRGSNPGSRTVIGFALATREAVDHRYAQLVDAGYEGLQPPYDAFWGQRYAVVADPGGNHIGLMSPQDDHYRTWPPTLSPGR